MPSAKCVKFTDGIPKDGIPVTLFSNGYPDANGLIFYNKDKPVIQFARGFTKGYFGQIAAIVHEYNHNLYRQIGTADEDLIWVLGTGTFRSFADALAEAKRNGTILAKVYGDVFTLPNMTKKDVEDFITKVFQLEHPDVNMPNKDEYAKYNTAPMFVKADVTPVVPSSKVSEPTKKLGFPADSGSAGWVPLSKSNGPTKEVKLSPEAKAELEKLEAELSDKTKEVADNKVELVELQKQVSSLQKQIEAKEAANVKARNILNKKRELAILEAE